MTYRSGLLQSSIERTQSTRRACGTSKIYNCTQMHLLACTAHSAHLRARACSMANVSCMMLLLSCPQFMFPRVPGYMHTVVSSLSRMPSTIAQSI